MNISSINKGDESNVREFIKKASVTYSNTSKNWNNKNTEMLFKIDKSSLNFKVTHNGEIVSILSYFKLNILGDNFLNFMSTDKEILASSLSLLRENIGIRKDKIFLLISEENQKLTKFFQNYYYFDQEIKIQNKKYLVYAMFLRDYTYAVYSENLTQKDIRKVFSKRGNWKPFDKSNKGNPDYLYLDGKYAYSSEIYDKYKEVLLKNQIAESKYITKKNKLYESIKDMNSVKNYILENYSLDLNNLNINFIKKLFNKGNVWIFKPAGGWSGVGIETFESYQKLKIYIDSLKNRNFYKKMKDRNSWVLQEYISNPMLIMGRKFHMRSYYLVHHEKSYVYNHSQIYTAKSPYKNSDFQNKDIHDTHMKNSIKDLYFPESLKISKKDKSIIQGKIIDLLQKLNLIRKYKCFQESKDCYEILGVDLMVTKDMELKILEINDKLGFKIFKDTNFNQELFENEVEKVVDKIFPPKNKTVSSSSKFFIPITSYDRN